MRWYFDRLAGRLARALLVLPLCLVWASFARCEPMTEAELTEAREQWQASETESKAAEAKELESAKNLKEVKAIKDRRFWERAHAKQAYRDRIETAEINEKAAATTDQERKAIKAKYRTYHPDYRPPLNQEPVKLAPLITKKAARAKHASPAALDAMRAKRIKQQAPESK